MTVGLLLPPQCGNEVLKLETQRSGDQIKIPTQLIQASVLTTDEIS